MQYIQGISRNQLQMRSLEDKISTDNSVRFIDAFVSFIDLKKVGFEPKNDQKHTKKNYLASKKLYDNPIIDETEIGSPDKNRDKLLPVVIRI